MQASRDKFEFQVVLWNPFVGIWTAVRFLILVWQPSCTLQFFYLVELMCKNVLLDQLEGL